MTYSISFENVSNTGAITGSGDYVGGLAGWYKAYNSHNGGYVTYFSNLKNTGDVTGALHTGGLFGYAYSEGGSLEVGVNQAAVKGTAYVGCIAGEIHGIVLNNCVNDGSTLEAIGYVTNGSQNYAYVGGFAGYAGTSINDSTNRVTIDYAKDGMEIGGVFGYCSTGDSMKNVRNEATVDGYAYVGGIFGQFDQVLSSSSTTYSISFENVSNTGAITGSGDYVGGLAGWYKAYNSHNGGYVTYFSNLKNTGDVTGALHTGGLFGYAYSEGGSLEVGVNQAAVKGTAYVGCIAGEIHEIVLNNCVNDGSTLVATGYYLNGSNKYAYVGGFAGYAGTSINDSTNRVAIDYAKDGTAIGGVFGYCSTGNSMKNVRNEATVNGYAYVGGIFGQFDRVLSSSSTTYSITFENVSNAGAITGSGDYVGGLAGWYKAHNSHNGGYVTYFSNLKNTGDVTGALHTGGLFGYAYSEGGSLEVGVNQAAVKGTAYVGCIAGEIHEIVLNNCVNDGSALEATGYVASGSLHYAYVGGFAGYAGTSINDSTNRVAIDYAKDGTAIGGVFGYCSTGNSMKNVRNEATVNGYAYVGGIFGQFDRVLSSSSTTYSITFENVSNAGAITGSGDYVGGLAGWYKAHNSHNGGYASYFSSLENTGNVRGALYTGGLFGYAYSESNSSTISDYTSTGTVIGTEYYDSVAGKIENIQIQ